MEIKKRYVIRKFILADNMEEALRIEKTRKPDECYLSEKSVDNVGFELPEVIGYDIEYEEEEDK